MASMQGKSPWITILSSPSQFFATRRDKLSWVWILTAYSIVSAIGTALQVPYVFKSAAWIHAMATATASSPAVVGTAKMGVEVGGPIGALISVWIVVFLSGLVLWILTKLFGVPIRYMNVVKVIANTSIIGIFAIVINTIITLATGTLTKSFLTLGMFHVTGHIGGLLTAIGVFSLWSLYIQIVGIAEMGAVTKAKASGPVVTLFVILILLGAITG